MSQSLIRSSWVTANEDGLVHCNTRLYSITTLVFVVCKGWKNKSAGLKTSSRSLFSYYVFLKIPPVHHCHAVLCWSKVSGILVCNQDLQADVGNRPSIPAKGLPETGAHLRKQFIKGQSNICLLENKSLWVHDKWPKNVLFFLAWLWLAYLDNKYFFDYSDRSFGQYGQFFTILRSQ